MLDKKVSPRFIPQRLVQIYSELIGRGRLRSLLGMSYDDERDLYKALGYKQELKYEDFATYFKRLDIAKAIINRPVDATWRGGMQVLDSDETKETLKLAWTKLEKEFKIVSKLKRLDKLASLGQYGILFMGLSDVQKPEELQNEVSGEKLKLLYLKPYGEGNAKIKTYETNSNSSRYGLPKTYEITNKVPGQSKTQNIIVHHSRVLHIVNECLENDAEGTPVLEAVFNRLVDIEKIVGGSGEMFWRGARPGYQAKIDPEYTMTPDVDDDLQDQFNEFENNLRRILMMQGVNLEALAPQVEDPMNHVSVQVDFICAVTQIPKRILFGSERGELASTQDRENWFDRIDSRREDFAEPVIARPFVDICMERGILPAVPENDYTIEWKDLRTPGDKDRADVGKIRSEALDKYSNNPISQNIIPPDAFRKHFLGFSDDQITEIEAMREKEMLEEEDDFEGIENDQTANRPAARDDSNQQGQ